MGGGNTPPINFKGENIMADNVWVKAKEKGVYRDAMRQPGQKFQISDEVLKEDEYTPSTKDLKDVEKRVIKRKKGTLVDYSPAWMVRIKTPEPEVTDELPDVDPDVIPDDDGASDDNDSTEGAALGDLDKKPKLINVLNGLDHENDEHWIASGEPNVQAVRRLMEDQTVGREEIKEAVPGLVRKTKE